MITDLETEALVKCTGLLRELSPESKMRVLKYLFERFYLEQVNYTDTLDLSLHSLSNKVIKDAKTENPFIDENRNKPSKSKKVKVPSLNLVTTLDLNPPKEISLKAFVAKYEVPRDYFEKNLLIIYYLDKIIKVPDIGLNHIYTCYKHIGLKDPANLYQSLVDTKNKKGWIEISDRNNIKVTRSGEIFIDQEMPKTDIEIVNLLFSSIL